MPEVLILILCMVLLTLLLGLPLLLKPDSPIPEIISFFILSAALLAFVWGTGTYWVAFPVLAVVAFVAWLDRGGLDRRAAGPAGSEAGAPPKNRRADAERWASDRTETRFRLWRAANRLQLALTVCALILFSSGAGMAAVTVSVAWMLVAMVASAGFRFSFYRSVRRDDDAPAIGQLAR